MTCSVSVAALMAGALGAGTVAAVPTTESPSNSGPPASAGGFVGPVPITADSVTWDEDGSGEGDDDHLGPEAESGAEFTTNDYTWERTELTYGFDTWTSDLSTTQQAAAVGAALDTWAAVTPLTFTRVADCGLAFNHAACTTPDIRIRFGSGDHGTGSSDPDFDGAGGVVAHAYGPVPDAWNFTAGGDIHLDEAETWRTNGASLDLETVVLHESGHALGLGHTNKSCAGSPGPNRPIMCSVLTGVQRVLSADDINGIQALYGEAPPTDIPDGIDVEILPPGSSGTEGSGTNDHEIKIVNGSDNALAGASLDVTGINGCDRATLAVPANAVTYSICSIDPTGHLVTELDTSSPLALTATLRATGIADTSDGPVDVAIVAPGNTFSDVPAWASPAVDWITFWNLADGFRDSTYRPDREITRAEVTRMIWRYAGSPTAGGSHSFSDVPAWVEDAVDWATFDPQGEEAPLMAGFSDGTFRPDDPITRGQVVRLLYRYVGSPSVTWLPGHGFYDVPAWVQDAVRWAAHDPDDSGPLKPVVSGYSNNTFRPNNDITRAQLTNSLFNLTDQLVD